MAHGYYNLKGEFVATASKEEATYKWREERGYNPVGIYDMGGGEVIDTRKVKPSKPATPKPTAPAVPTVGGEQEGYDVQGIQRSEERRVGKEC